MPRSTIYHQKQRKQNTTRIKHNNKKSKTTTTIKVIISLAIIASLLVVVAAAAAHAELYEQYDGTYITEEEYDERVIICGDEKVKGKLDLTTNCLEWALTQNAQSQKAFNDIVSGQR